MKQLTAIILCAMLHVAARADEVITNFVGRWTIEKTVFKQQEPSARDANHLKQLTDSAAIVVTTNSLKISTHFENLDLDGTNVMSMTLASTHPKPPSATFVMPVSEGMIWTNKVTLTKEGLLQFTESNTRHPLGQFLWRRREDVEHPSAHVLPKAANGL